jgi:thiamine biosynthesis lipoprotein
MGSRWSAVYFDEGSVDEAAFAATLAAAVEEVEAEMSNWRPDSDLERLNRAPVGSWVGIPAMLAEVLETALAVGRLSDGAFDIGVGDLVRVWGFGGGSRRFDAAGVAAIGGRASFEPPKTLEIDRAGGRARRHAPLALDLSGIAKGFGVDRMAAVARAFGITSFLVGIDGELRAGAAKPDGRPWAVGQERPDREARSLLGVIDLVDAAVAGSGDYRRTIEVDGRSLSHTIDPATGAPVIGDLAAVSVVAENCMLADAWATALMVLGVERGTDLAHRLGLWAVFVDHRGRVTPSVAAAALVH